MQFRTMSAFLAELTVLCVVFTSISTCQGDCDANSFSILRGGIQVCQCNKGYACAFCNSSSCATDGKTTDEWGCVSDGLSLKYLAFREEARVSEVCVDTSLYCNAPSQDDDYTTFRAECDTYQKYLGAVCGAGETCNTSSYGKYPNVTTCDNASSYGPNCVGKNEIDTDTLAPWVVAVVVIAVVICVAMTGVGCFFMICRSYCAFHRPSHGDDNDIGRSLTHAQFNNPNADDTYDVEDVDDDDVDDGRVINDDEAALYTTPPEESNDTDADV